MVPSLERNWVITQARGSTNIRGDTAVSFVLVFAFVTEVEKAPCAPPVSDAAGAFGAVEALLAPPSVVMAFVTFKPFGSDAF